MREEHLSYEELEKYMEEDLSEAYLCWSEPITEHLDACKYCRKRLDDLFLLTELCSEENMVDAIRLMGKEEEIKRRLLALRIEHMAENQRMLEVANQLRQGLLTSMCFSKTELVRGQSVMRGEEASEPWVEANLEDGVLTVKMAMPKQKDEAVVILIPQSNAKKNAVVKIAKRQKGTSYAVAEFEVGESEEDYELLIDVLTDEYWE